MPIKDAIFHLREILSSRAIKRSMLPIAACGDSLHVADKTPIIDIMVCGLRKSSHAGKQTDEGAVMRLSEEDIAPVIFVKPNGENVLMLDYRTSVDGIGCLILALPLFDKPYDRYFAAQIERTVNHTKALIRASFSELLNSEAVPGSMLDMNIAARDARCALAVYERMELRGGKFAGEMMPGEFEPMFRNFLSDFRNCMCEYGPDVAVRLPESLDSVSVSLSKEDFFSLLTVLLLALYIMSDDRKLIVSAEARANAVELSLSTAFIRPDAKNARPLLPDYNGISLDSLSSELVRIGHPLAIDILLASACIDASDLTAAFSLKNMNAEFRLTIPAVTSPTEFDITSASEYLSG